MRATTLTSYFLLIPLATSLYFNLYIYTFLIILSFISSLKYHVSSEKEWGKVDSALAAILFLLNLYVCFLLKSQLKFIIPIVLITITAFFFFNQEKYNYEFYHSLWHIAVITGTFLCVLGLGLL
jgi:hypothetical protein